MDTADRLLSCLSSALLPGGNNARVTTTLAGELDAARSTATTIGTVRNPDLMTGRTLDYVAKMFNVARTAGESDDSLRSRIMTQIKRYYSCGTLADIRDVVEYFTGLTGDQVRIWEPPDVHEGWGYGEGRYGALPWGTPHAIFRIELLTDPDPVDLPGLMAAIDLVRAAGVYVQDLIISSPLQEVLSDAEGSVLWVVPAPLRTGFGADGYGAGSYGYCAYAVRATAESAIDLVIEPTAAVTAQAASYLGYAGWRYGQYEFGF